MFILFQTPAFACGPDDPEMERAMWPGWEDPWHDPWRDRGYIDVNRDPGMEGRFEWRPQRFVDHDELGSL